MPPDSSNWLAVVVGNSRIQWAECDGSTLLRWQYGPPPPHSDCWCASTGRHSLPLQPTYAVQLDDIPIAGLYPTLGIDRALALWAGLALYQAPLLVVDGGTALTFSGVDHQAHFYGGAISPGLALQRRALSEQTAALPEVQFNHEALPPRWARDTRNAIRSGIEYGMLAAVERACLEWRRHFPSSAIAFTGGDGEWLWQNLGLPKSYWQPTLVLAGIIRVRAIKTLRKSS